MLQCSACARGSELLSAGLRRAPARRLAGRHQSAPAAPRAAASSSAAVARARASSPLSAPWRPRSPALSGPRPVRSALTLCASARRETCCLARACQRTRVRCAVSWRRCVFSCSTALSVSVMARLWPCLRDRRWLTWRASTGRKAAAARASNLGSLWCLPNRFPITHQTRQAAAGCQSCVLLR